MGHDEATNRTAPAPEAIRAQMERLVAGESFHRSRRLSRFLRYVVEETLDGRGDQLKEYRIALDVFGRPESYDPQIDSLVRVEASKLRSKLARHYASQGPEDAVVITLPKGGYVPEFEVRRLETPPESLPPAPPRRARIWVAAAAVGALGMVVTAWLAWSGGPAPASQLSIAVLAFENTGDPETQYLSDGVSESLINSLSVLPRLRVVARATAFRYRGHQTDLKKVGQELGVRSVVTGSLFQRGDELRIQVDLVDTATGSQVWGQQYRRASREIVDVQQEMAMAVIQKLRLPLSSSERERLAGMLPQNVAAHRAYLQGRFLWNKRSPQGLRKAIQYFEQAIREDPGYAPAHAGLSNAYAASSWYASIPTREAELKARPAAMAALKLAPDSADAHASLGTVHRLAGNYEASRQELIRALELNPANDQAQRSLGLHFLWAGRFGEARELIRRAYELDPVSVPANINLGELLYYSRQYDQAIEQFRRTIELDPSYFWAHERLGQAFEQKRMYDAAIVEYQRAMELGGELSVVGGSLGHAYALSGKVPEAQAMLARIQDLSRSEYVSPYSVAVLHAGLRRDDEAFEWLERALAERAAWLVWLKLDPRLDRLRSDPRFEDLAKRSGLP